jgi:hypothetical protein
MCVYVCVWMCECVYVSAIEIQTTELILVKFGTGILLSGGKACSLVLTSYPDSQGQGDPKGGLACLFSLNVIVMI